MARSPSLWTGEIKKDQGNLGLLAGFPGPFPGHSFEHDRRSRSTSRFVERFLLTPTRGLARVPLGLVNHGTKPLQIFGGRRLGVEQCDHYPVQRSVEHP